MSEALALVRQELGPEAAVLHTREVRAGRLFGLLPGKRHIEVTASAGVNVPSRLRDREAPDPVASRGQVEAVVASPDQMRRRFGDGTDFAGGIDIEARMRGNHAGERPEPATQADAICRAAAAASKRHPSAPAKIAPVETSAEFRNIRANAGAELGDAMSGQLRELRELVQALSIQSRDESYRELPEQLFHVFTDLLDADIPEQIARDLVDRVRKSCASESLEPRMLKARIARLIESEVVCGGPIEVTPGKCRIVALVGPTGVGKTTTIAKLAANYRLKAKQRVGLITVDTYRIAAVEQLRTYADIIDLPMQVVSTPREMRDAVRKLDDLDLILMDTAGRSPKDEVKIQELKSFLTEAGADEVHLVLSAVAGSRTLCQTAERFAPVGTTSLLLTKLDESPSLGGVLPLLRRCDLPVSYITNGQNVPDDIETATSPRIAQLILDPSFAEV